MSYDIDFSVVAVARVITERATTGHFLEKGMTVLVEGKDGYGYRCKPLESDRYGFPPGKEYRQWLYDSDLEFIR